MFATILMSVALIGQAPRNEIADGPARPPNQAQRIAARKAALTRANRTREYRQAQAEAAERRAYQAALPAMLAAERERFARMTAMEQTAALQRMAGASERSALIQQMDMMQRRNARLGYGTPALDNNSPVGQLYGPYGAVIYGPNP